MLDTTTYDRATVLGLSQIELEEHYSKYQLMDAIRDYFRSPEFEAQLEAWEIPADFGINLMAQMSLHKRAAPEVLIGILRPFFEDSDNPAQACSDMLLLAIENDLCDYDTISGVLIVNYEIPLDLQARIDEFQYPLPMIEAPLPIENNRETGYRTIRRSIILKNNHHEEDVCLDHLNRVNAQKLALNTDIVAFTQNSWKDLDRPKEGETQQDFETRQRAFEKFDRTSRDVLSGLLELSDGFWMTHAYDKRGRTYAQGYHVNYQGNDWQKACVQFAKAEPINKD